MNFFGAGDFIPVGVDVFGLLRQLLLNAAQTHLISADQLVDLLIRHNAHLFFDVTQRKDGHRSEEHTSNSSHVAISYAVFCLKKKNMTNISNPSTKYKQKQH